MANNLPECPFCGGRALRICGVTSWIECERCVAKTSQCRAIEKAEELWSQRIDPAGEINRLRERLGPRGLEVVMIGERGHYVSAAVKAEIESLRMAPPFRASNLAQDAERGATLDTARVTSILEKHIKLDWLNASDGKPEIIGIDDAVAELAGAHPRSP
jgi:hypothetical protein